MIEEPDWDAADPDLAEPFCDWAGNVYLWLGTFADYDTARAYFSESLPNTEPDQCMLSPFMRDYFLRQSPHYFREAGHVQWDMVEPDLLLQMKRLTCGEVFHKAAVQMIDEGKLGEGANVLVVLYESDQGTHNAFQPKAAKVQTPLTFVGCFCIDGELVEVLDALPQNS